MTTPVSVQTLVGTDMIRLIRGGRFAVCTLDQLAAYVNGASPAQAALAALTTRVAADEAGDAALTQRVAAAETTVAGLTTGEAAHDARLGALETRAGANDTRDAALAARVTGDEATIAGLTSTEAGHETRIAALEAKPEEVVPFSGSITTGLLAIGTKAFTVTGLTGLKAGERIVAEPTNALPAGVSIAAARVPSDGTAEVTLAAVLALTASATLALKITALR